MSTQLIGNKIEIQTQGFGFRMCTSSFLWPSLGLLRSLLPINIPSQTGTGLWKMPTLVETMIYSPPLSGLQPAFSPFCFTPSLYQLAKTVASSLGHPCNGQGSLIAHFWPALLSSSFHPMLLLGSEITIYSDCTIWFVLGRLYIRTLTWFDLTFQHLMPHVGLALLNFQAHMVCIWILQLHGCKTLNKLYTSLKFIGKGNGTPLQYFCLENPMDRGPW